MRWTRWCSEMILYVNACVRTDSRTDRIAKALLQKLGGAYEEVKLSGAFQPLTEETLDRRTALIAAGEASLNYAQCFKTDAPVHEGDVISVRGCGKGIVGPEGGKSRKDRIFITADIFS